MSCFVQPAAPNPKIFILSHKIKIWECAGTGEYLTFLFERWLKMINRISNIFHITLFDLMHRGTFDPVECKKWLNEIYNGIWFTLIVIHQGQEYNCPFFKWSFLNWNAKHVCSVSTAVIIDSHTHKCNSHLNHDDSCWGMMANYSLLLPGLWHLVTFKWVIITFILAKTSG